MMLLNWNELISEISSLNGKRIFITFHSVGDTDSVSSAFGLASLFSKATISSPDYITSNSKRILYAFGYDPSAISTDFPYKPDAIIMVDVNNYSDCGKFSEKLREYESKIIVIDHHAPSNDNLKGFNDEGYNSTASIVYKLLKALKTNPSEKLAALLAAGIISDSAEFKNSTPDTFIQLGELFKIAKTDYVKVHNLISNVGDVNGRLLTFEDLQNAHIEIYNDILVVTGIAHSHPNLAADNAIKCGVDLALFYSVSDSEVSFSSRLRPTLDQKYGIHLGKISQKLAYILEGSGGGHPCAAGAFGNRIESADIFMEAFMNEILHLIKGGSK
ncbi:MAG: DHH family phosphoesterase [Candidatus Micrarchaeaceae archaeon]